MAYIKQGFSAGKPLKAAQLEAMEEGIIEAQELAANNGGSGEAASTDAELKLSAPFTITKDFGYYTLNGAASKEIGTTGQSLHEFLQGAFAQEDRTIFLSTPSCSISMSSGNYEIGSTVNPSASWSTSAGTYKWGTYNNETEAADYTNKATGITYSKGDITIDKTNFVITEDTKVTALGTAVRSTVTNYPCSNLGSDLTSELAEEYKNSKTLDCTKSVTFTCYREGFFYGISTSKINTSELASADIRALSKTNAGYVSGKKTFTVPVGAATIIFACPADKTGVTKVYNKTVNADMTSSFTKTTGIKVNGAENNNPVDYNIWTFIPSEAYGVAADLEITLG